jgi:hypothetical protein
MLVMDLLVPLQPEEGLTYLDPMEAFLADAEAEFDRLMKTDPKFREFVLRSQGNFAKARG